MYNDSSAVKFSKQRALQAVCSNNLKHFLVDWFTFRLHITFKKSIKMDAQAKRHFYGNEHQCTLNQIFAGHVTEINLNRLKGYTDLIKLVEQDWKGKWTSAVIYMRDEPRGAFNTVVRKYYLGKMEDEQSPVLSDEVFKLYYHGINEDKLPVFKPEPFFTEPVPDFKTIVKKQLSN